MQLAFLCTLLVAACVVVHAAPQKGSWKSPWLQSLAYHEVVDVYEHPVLTPQEMKHWELKLHSLGSYQEKVRHPHHIEYKIEAHGKTFHLRLIKNHALIHPEYREYRIGEQGSKRTRGRKDFMHCYYTGKVVGVRDSAVAVSTCNGIDGFISTPDEHYHIKPAGPHTDPHYDVSSTNKKWRTAADLKHIVYKTSDLPKSSRPDFKCGVGNEDTSFHKRKKANAPEVPLSCDSNSPTHTHEEHEQEQHHSHSHDHAHDHHESLSKRLKTKATHHLQHHLGVKYPEVVIFNDYSRFQSYGLLTESHTASIMNMVASYYTGSTGLNEITNTLVTLTAQVTWTDNNKIANNTNANGHILVDDYLSDFAVYQATTSNWVPNGDPVPPKDNAALFSGFTFRDSIVGYAYTWQMCLATTSAAINQMNHIGNDAFDSATAAHELGHNLGMCHDTPAARASQCGTVTGLSCGSRIMSASSSLSSPNSQFSACSEADYLKYLSGQSPVNTQTACLDTVPSVFYNNTAVCGNGFVEPGEDCDCAGAADCALAPAPWTDACCTPNCTFVSQANCSDARACCENCQLVSAAVQRTCRAKGAGGASTDCDNVEYCDGVSPDCPPDSFEQDGQNCPTDLAAVAADWIEDNWELLAIGAAGLVGLCVAYKCVCKCWSCCCSDGEEVSGKQVVRRVVKGKNGARANRHQQGIQMANKGGRQKVATVGGIALPPWWQVRYTRDGIPIYINTNTGHMYDFRNGPPRAVGAA